MKMKHLKMFEAFINEEKMDAQELANHVWMNWKKITGLSNSKRNEEGHFPDKVMVLLKQHGVDYMAFSDAWNDAAEMNEAMGNKESLHAFWDKTIDSCKTEKEWLKKATGAGFSEADAKKLADDLEQGGDSYIAWAKEVFVNEGEI